MHPATPSRNGRRATSDDEPALPRKPKTLPKVFSQEEVTALMEVPNLSAPTGLRNRAMLELILGSGLRVSETCGLHLRDVRWAEYQLHLRPEITKGQVEAMAYLGESAIEWLQRWKAVRRLYAAGKPHLFTTLKGGPLDRRYVWSMLGRYARRAGIDRAVGPHMLRHTFATDLLRSGDFDLREVQTLLRHADIRTTTLYTHIVDADLSEKMRRR